MKGLKGNLQERIAFLKLKSGDSDAFVFFYDKYVDRIFRFVYIRVSDKTTAEDLTQDIFMKTWQHLVDKKNLQNFQAFIFRVARNRVIDHYRKSSNQELPLDYVPEITDIANNLEDKLDSNIELENATIELKKLKPEYQEILLLRHVEDLSIDDIAQILDKDKNNVRVLLHRATKKLKDQTGPQN